MEDLLQTVESIKDTYSSIEMGFLYLPKQQAGIKKKKKKNHNYGEKKACFELLVVIYNYTYGSFPWFSWPAHIAVDQEIFGESVERFWKLVLLFSCNLFW